MMDTVGNKAAQRRDRDDQGGGAEHGLPGDRLGDPGPRRRRRQQRLRPGRGLCRGARCCASPTAPTRCTATRSRGWSCASTVTREHLSLPRSGVAVPRKRRSMGRVSGSHQPVDARCRSPLTPAPSSRHPPRTRGEERDVGRIRLHPTAPYRFSNPRPSCARCTWSGPSPSRMKRAYM